MRELENNKKDEVKIVSEKQHEKKRVLLGSARVKPNHRCFEINVETKEINEAKYIISATYGNGVKKQVDVKEGCVYIIAMNKANAMKKFNKGW